MFSIITMASSTTKPVEMVSAISVRLLMEKPARYITPNVPTSDSGTAKLGMSVAEALRKTQNHRHHQANGQRQLGLHVFDRGADGGGAVGEHLNIHRRRQRGLQLGQQGLDAIDRVDHVGARLAADVEDDAGLGARLGVPAQAARRVFSASSTVCATSRRRMGLPF